MTKQEAEAFLARNPRINKERLAELCGSTELAQVDRFYDFGGASNEADALVNLIEVYRALTKAEEK